MREAKYRMQEVLFAGWNAKTLDGSAEGKLNMRLVEWDRKSSIVWDRIEHARHFLCPLWVVHDEAALF